MSTNLILPVVAFMHESLLIYKEILNGEVTLTVKNKPF